MRLRHASSVCTLSPCAAQNSLRQCLAYLLPAFSQQIALELLQLAAPGAYQVMSVVLAQHDEILLADDAVIEHPHPPRARTCVPPCAPLLLGW